MNKLEFKYTCLGLVALLVSASALAEPVTVDVTGNIIAAPCEVSSDSITKTIVLDDGNGFQSKDLQTAGSTTPWVNFTINLSSCPAGTRTATITASGTEDADNSAYYKNAGSAKKIALELDKTGGGVILSNGKSFSTDVIDGAAEFKLAARTVTTKGGVTPGSIQFVVTANFTYQ